MVRRARSEDEAPTLQVGESSGVRSKLDREVACDEDLEATNELPAARQRMLGGRYVLRETLGIGGMSMVIAAHDTVTGREVALKVPRTRAGRDTLLRRARREAEATMSVDDAFVCHVDEVSFEGTQPILVMERLHGETLRDRMRRHGPLGFAEAIDIASQLLDALDAVHEAGVVHRDVKPANVFLADDGVKLIDFGVAARIGQASNDLRTESLEAFGTVDYLAPERILEQPSVDHRVDIWSAGITLFVALTGAHPFRRERWDDQVRVTLLDDPPLVSGFRRDVPIGVDHVLRTALAKTPERRFPSARAFRSALRAVAGPKTRIG